MNSYLAQHPNLAVPMHHQIIFTDAERIILGTERPAPSASEAIDPFFMNMNTLKNPSMGPRHLTVFVQTRLDTHTYGCR